MNDVEIKLSLYEKAYNIGALRKALLLLLMILLWQGYSRFLTMSLCFPLFHRLLKGWYRW